MCENVFWGHVSAQRLLLEGMDHFPTVKIESDWNCVLPWLMTGWEDRPSPQHNSIWAKYLYWGGTTSLTHNTFIHVRESYLKSRAAEIHWVHQKNTTVFSSDLERVFLYQPEWTMSFWVSTFCFFITMCQIGSYPASGEWTFLTLKKSFALSL